jgi:hypothetical protein
MASSLVDCSVMAVFVVEKSNWTKLSHIEIKIIGLCEAVSYEGDFVSLTPKLGMLVSIGVILRDEQIPYQMIFDDGQKESA